MSEIMFMYVCVCAVFSTERTRKFTDRTNKLIESDNIFNQFQQQRNIKNSQEIFCEQRSFCCKCIDTSIVEHYRANRIFARDMYRVCIFLINYCNSSHFGGGLDFVQIYLMRCRERKVCDIMQSDFGNIYVHDSQQI